MKDLEIFLDDYILPDVEAKLQPPEEEDTEDIEEEAAEEEAEEEGEE